MATIETTKKTVEHVKEYVEGVQELTNSVTVARQEDADDHKISKFDAIKKDKAAVLWCLFVVWTSLLVSFESNASGNVIGIPQFRQNFGSLYNGEYVLAAKWQSAFTAAPTASFAVGALTCGFISDTIGRKYTIMAGFIGSYVSVTMEVVANTNGLFFAGKFLNGFVVGMLAAVCPTYLGEIVPLALRAPLTAAVIVNSTGTKTNVWAYRSVFCAQYGFCFVSTVFAPFIPESPWWLASKGRDEKALTSLRRLACNTDIEAVRKLALIKVTLEEIRRETEGVRERVNGPQAPDITVKYLHNNKSYTILTMENKHASGWHLGSSWKSALTELDEYLDLIPESAKPNPTFQVRMVGIGLFVRFYCRRKGGATEDYPRSGGEMLHVKRDARKIQRLLKGIKERTADWLVVNV